MELSDGNEGVVVNYRLVEKIHIAVMGYIVLYECKWEMSWVRKIHTVRVCTRSIQ